MKRKLRMQHLIALSVVCGGLIGALAQSTAGQGAMAGHTMGEVEEAAPDTLPVPQKLAGIGNVHLKITATPEAQMWFDQGLNLLHDFWDYEAAKAFEQAIRVDPNCAMCYWGQYQTEIFRHSAREKYAAEALANAVSRKKTVTKAERLYIEASQAAGSEAIAKRMRGHLKNTKEVKIWRKLVKQNSADTQARIFLAEAVIEGYDEKGEPRAGTKEALAILQSVLKDEPENSAANHYWIHAVEASPHPEQAVHSSEILGRLAPTSGHMVHMPGHIFYRTGDYESAQKSFSASTQADETYMQTMHVPVDDDWNYVHNMMYSIANLMELGRLKDATALSERSTGARGQLAATLYVHSPRDSTARLDPRLPVAMRTADWAQVLNLLKTKPSVEELPNLAFLRQELSDFATGMLAVDAHEAGKAEEASVRFDAELAKKSEIVKADKAANEKKKKTADDKGAPKMKVMPDASLEPLVNNLSVMSLELRAEIAMSRKQMEEAKKLFVQAEKEEKDLGYHEPPYYVRPVAETEGAALLASADWAGAKAAYERALVERPKSGFPLYGIALASERSGDAKQASEEFAEFAAAWKDADAGLPELEHAHKYLAEHKNANGDN